MGVLPKEAERMHLPLAGGSLTGVWSARGWGFCLSCTAREPSVPSKKSIKASIVCGEEKTHFRKSGVIVRDVGSCVCLPLTSPWAGSTKYGLMYLLTTPLPGAEAGRDLGSPKGLLEGTGNAGFSRVEGIRLPTGPAVGLSRRGVKGE